MHVNNERTRYLRTHELAALKNEALKVVAQEKEGQPESVLHERWLYDIIVAAVSTGLRRGKLCAVRCRDVERDDKGNLWLFIGEDKNGQPLNKPVAGELKGIVEHRLACAIGDAFLLPGPRNGNAYTSIARYLPVVVERVAEAHPDWGLRWGISRDGITFHTLRHSMASLAANNGVPLDVVQRMGNWRTASMMRRYAHLADERLQDGEARLAAVLHISSQSAKDEDSDEVLSR